MKNRLLLTSTLVLLFSFAFASKTPAGDRSHSYLVVTPPSQLKPYQPSTSRPKVYTYGVSRQPYAYGWFGVRPQRQPTRTRGYNTNYIQWSFR